MSTRTKAFMTAPISAADYPLRDVPQSIHGTSHACGLEGGMPKERYQRYHEEKAKGGIGLTMFGGSSNVAPVRPLSSNSFTSATTKLFPICGSSRSVFTNTCGHHVPDPRLTTRRAVPGAGCPPSARPPFAKRYIEVF